jgi:hypothetical protein
MGAPIPSPNANANAHRKPRKLLPQALILAVAIILFIQFTILPRFISEPSIAAQKLSNFQLTSLEAGLSKCAELTSPPVEYALPTSSRENPRHNSITGQKQTIVLRNATLFDGKTFSNGVDVTFTKGILTVISPASAWHQAPKDDEVEIDLEGKYVTPGLIDMHSHHLVGSWPGLLVNGDGNEMHPSSGPLTPFVRAKDSIKTDDAATAIIASGGVTSSLILPGSANIMGGEGIMVKNLPNSGIYGEEVVEDILLEHGIPMADRRKYMKMACGENPKRVYGHTRMGDAYIFRHHMERAKELVQKQDSWCLSAAAARESGDMASIAALVSNKGGLPEELELESSGAMLRGKIGINVHCYEPEDIEDMLLHSKEFGFRIQAFHHALEAWEVPELIKASGEYATDSRLLNRSS